MITVDDYLEVAARYDHPVNDRRLNAAACGITSASPC